MQEGGEVGVGAGRLRVQDEEACGECGDGAEDEKDDGDALAGDDERVGDGEGFGFGGLPGEPCGDEEDEGGQGWKDVVLLPGGEAEEEQGDCGPDAEQDQGALLGA